MCISNLSNYIHSATFIWIFMYTSLKKEKDIQELLKIRNKSKKMHQKYK